MLKWFVKLQVMQGESGATALEYAILVAFIALVIIAGVTVFGSRLNSLFMGIAGRVPGM